jgi:hypothetical protein
LAPALVLAAVLAATGPAVAAPAAGPSGSEVGAVTASAPAVKDATVATDVVSVYTARQLPPNVADAAVGAAMNAGGAGLVLNAGVLGLLTVQRGDQTVSAAPAGYRYALSTTVFPPEAAGRVVGRDVSRTLALGGVVVNAVTAAMHGIQAGDTITVLGWDGAPHVLGVGQVAPDAEVGAELLIPPTVADGVGLARPSSVVLWGFRSRTEIDQQLAAAGLVTPTVRIRHSWDPPDPDGLLSYADIKQALGEFAFKGTDTTMQIEPGWVPAHLSTATFPLGVRSFCHNVVIPALQSAFAEVAARGLGAAIDVGNTNTFGGCFNAHEITPLGSTTGGFLSKHSWGMAIDMNTVENPEGSPPTMNCDVVRIFRKWGFAWGGNFLQGDGMHFEWVGQARDQLAFPSRYCPNIVTAAATPSAASGPTTTATNERALLFAGEVSH